MLLVALAACSRPTPNTPVLAVSIEPQRHLLEAIAGDYAQVVSIMPQSANPEAFEPGMEQMKSLETAAAYFRVGTLPFETNITRQFPGVKTVDTPCGELRENDPHIWSSLANARQQATVMCDELCKMEPSRSQYFTARRDSLMAVLNTADSLIHSRLDSLSCREFFVWHPSLTYFASDYGLRQLAFESHQKETSAHDMKERVNAAQNSCAKVFFCQKQFDSRAASEVCRDLNATMVEVDLMSYDFVKELINVANTLYEHSK